ncbi:MAG TPA: OmpA family protein, partial [Usitatibacter sp.]
ICAAHVIPVQPRGVLADHAVAVDGGRIVAVLPTAQALERYEAREVVRPDGKKSIDEALAKLNGVDLEMVIATGHTDSIGTDAYNQKLSERRAAAVKDYLVSKGIPASKITTIGKGESQPVATNKTKEGRQMNRRVDIEFKGIKVSK